MKNKKEVITVAKLNMIIKNKDNKTVFHPQCIVFFEENHIKVAKLNNNQIFFVVPNKDVFREFETGIDNNNPPTKTSDNIFFTFM